MRCGDGDPSYFYPLCPLVEAKLKEIEERYRAELRERKACVTFETELGRQLKALITSVQTEQSKCARPPHAHNYDHSYASPVPCLLCILSTKLSLQYTRYGFSNCVVHRLKEAIRLSAMIPAAAPITDSSNEAPEPAAPVFAAGASETPEGAAAGGRRMRESRAASLNGSATQSTLLPAELLDMRAASPEQEAESDGEGAPVASEPESGFGEAAAESGADRRAPPTLVQPRRQGPGILSAQELVASARARPHSALDPGRARAVESAVRTQQQVELARPASASVSTAAQDGHLTEHSLKQFGYIGEAQDYFDELVDRRRVTFRDRNSLLGPPSNDPTQPQQPTYEPLDDSRYPRVQPIVHLDIPTRILHQ